jgi:4-diphosphocytidyl-2-C-methyl-D-erythritol kinase
MLTFPNAKLNIGLYVTARRPDGYHTLESAFVPLPWCDALELVPAPEGQASRLALTGRPIPGDPAANLCLRAYELLKVDFPQLPPVQMHLHKIVPIGAGLGGGSADAAFALKLVNSEFRLGLGDDALESYARRLGADCAFFIRNQPVLAVEKGDVFEPLELNLKGTACAIIYPGLHISTAEAYGRITPRPPQHNLRAALAQPMETWRDTVSNDFENALTPHYPVLGEIKQLLYAAGAIYASLSGSGSAVYGLFSKHTPVPSLSVNADCLLWTGLL